MLTKLIAATVAGAITFLILGFVIFGLILGPNVMLPNITPDAAKIMNLEPVWVWLILGYLVLAFLLAFVFQRWAGIRTFSGGVKGGAIILFLLDLYFQMMFLAFMKMHTSYLPVIVDVIGTAVIGAISGGVVGMVLGMMSKEDQSA